MISFRRVTVIPVPVRWSYIFARRGTPATSRPRATIGKCASVLLAGPLAETLYNPMLAAAAHIRCDTDESKHGHYVRFCPPAKADRWVNRLRFSTLEKLRAPDVWAMVEVVALELVRCKTLNSTQVAPWLSAKARQSGGRVATLQVPGWGAK